MRRSKASGTEHADAYTGCESATCPVCGTAMEVYRTISFDGAEVEGETPEKVRGL
jgi:hypothetical protein